MVRGEAIQMNFAADMYLYHQVLALTGQFYEGIGLKSTDPCRAQRAGTKWAENQQETLSEFWDEEDISCEILRLIEYCFFSSIDRHRKPTAHATTQRWPIDYDPQLSTRPKRCSTLSSCAVCGTQKVRPKVRIWSWWTLPGSNVRTFFVRQNSAVWLTIARFDWLF